MNAMGKGWPFYKTKHDHEFGSSRGGKRNVCERHYAPVDYVR
jgi:hypothetical protein